MNDKEFIEKVKTLSYIKPKDKERLPFGNKSRGKLIKSEEGRRAIFVPSFGSMEKEEIDYVVQEAQHQEDERVKKKSTSQTKVELESVAKSMKEAPRGERAKTGHEILGGKK